MEKYEEIKNLLAGFNCGACGYNNCQEMAKAICKGDARADDCLPIDEENIEIINNLAKKDK